MSQAGKLLESGNYSRCQIVEEVEISGVRELLDLSRLLYEVVDGPKWQIQSARGKNPWKTRREIHILWAIPSGQASVLPNCDEGFWHVGVHHMEEMGLRPVPTIGKEAGRLVRYLVGRSHEVRPCGYQ